MIIGVTGNIRAGKDTVAKMIQYYFAEKLNPKYCKEVVTLYRFLKNYYGTYENEVTFIYDWKIKKFAAKLKQIAAILVGCNAEDFEYQEFKDKVLSDEWQLPHQKIFIENARTNRWLLQTLGTEAIRDNIHENTWVNALFADYKPKNGFPKHINKEGKLVEKELIYPNWIISDVRFKNEAQAILDRNGIIIKVTRDKDESKTEFNHKSETELNSIIPNFHIENNGTIEELYEKVSDFLKNSNL